MEQGEQSGPIDGFKYKKNDDGTVNKYKVICKICNKEFQFHRSCSSLKYHVNAKHAFAGPSGSASGLRQTTLNVRRPLTKSTLVNLTNTIAKWIAKDCRPISIVEDAGFLDVLQVASQDSYYKPPSRATVMTKIHELYDNEKEKRKAVLAQVNHIALTGDHWTSVSNNNYLGVTAHFISDTWELKSFALTILKTEERHFAEACKEQFLSVARKWDIEGKTTTIGTDSARNMVAAIRLTRYEHMSCVAHMVQRSVTVSLADSGFVNALAKARKVVGHFKHSPANATELQAQQVSLGKKQEPLIQDVPTRWNSTLEMVKRLSRNKEAVIAALDNQEHKLVLTTAAEWDKLQRLEALLEPCRYVTELLGGEAYVSCSVVLPSLCHLRLKMEACDEDPAYVVRFKTKFKEDLASRQEQLNNAWLQIATVLDPRFKDLKCLPKTDREAVWTTLEGMLQQESPRKSSQTHDDGPPRKKISLLQMGSDSESEDEEVQPAIQRYRAEPTITLEDCPLKWWASHSGAHEKLASLAHKYLATPATTVPCERLFSVAGHIVNKKRSALLSENVKKLVCLSNWLKDDTAQ
ncbi:E3 SUMO-protein ligase ZBED1-like [Paramisgurnus dabryanus]|uniref:E3 SUMO-protein ligase ZBED1-like n=1 Tax=Paramisgurnus dabryanus TaxID=90735 RepID=UPI0031F3E460